MMLLEEKKTTKLLDKEKRDTVSRPTLYMPVGKSGKTQIHVVLPAKTGDYPVQHTLELDPYTVLTSYDTRLAAIHEAHSPSSFGLSATNQQYFSLRTNQPPATSQYFALRTYQHQPPAASQTNN
jgi:hypothetical protein